MNVTRICAQVVLFLVLLTAVPALPMMSHMPALGKRELCIAGGVVVVGVAGYGLYRVLRTNPPITKLEMPKVKANPGIAGNSLSSLMSVSLKERYMHNTECINAVAIIATLERDTLLEESVRNSPMTKETFKETDPMSIVDYRNPFDAKQTLKMSLWRKELLAIIWGAPSAWTGDLSASVIGL
jgi:hypothetical protein